jgi:hypothetical protein
MLRTLTPEQQAAKDEAKARKAAEREAWNARQAAEAERLQFLASPVGQARTAFERGDHLAQFAASVMSQNAYTGPIRGTTVYATNTDTSVVLNAICDEGWELVNSSFVFDMQGRTEQVAFMGEVIGYYLFRRCEANWVSSEQ